MQCPSCRSDIPDNQFYCPVCRASVYSYAPENVRSTNTRVERAGKRLLEVLLVLILIGIGIVLARAIKWNELVNNFLPGAVSTPTPKSERPQTSQADSSGKRKPTDSSAAKAGEKKSADSTKPASAESTSEKKEEPSKSESKPAAKPEGQPTPKPPSNDN